MNYKEAKELKDAGFPQKSEKSWYVEHGFPEVKNPEKYNKKHWKSIEYSVMDERTAKKQWGKIDKLCSDPTLEELIDACGERFGSLEMFRPNVDRIIWYARGYNYTVKYEGKTPLEAVRKLYIKLKV